MAPHDDTWLTELFADFDPEANARALAQAEAQEHARIAAVKAAMRTPALQVERCPRCGGSGQIPQYMHRNNGLCFRCGGTGRA